MQRFVWLVRGTFTLALCLCMAAACNDATAPAPAAGGMVSGRVALVKTAAGVPNAIVALLQDGNVLQAAPTDANGAYAFGEVPPGRYTVQLTGLELTGLDLRSTTFSPDFSVIEVQGALVAVLFAGHGVIPPQVTGEVFCGPNPLAGAAVRIAGGDTDRSATTGTQGRFAFTALPPGTYAVLLDTAAALPCTFSKPYEVVSLRDGQAATVRFAGS